MEKTAKILLAILIVVIAAIVVLIVIVPDLMSGSTNPFGGPNIGPDCLSNFRYVCQSPNLNTSGMLSMYIGQNTGMVEHNFAVACTASLNSSSGGPYASVSPWEYASSNGALSHYYNANDTLTMQSDMKLQLSGIQCYGQNGQPFSGNIGTPFTGYIWAEFTSNAGQPSPSNPFVIVKIASIKAIITRAA